MMKGIKTNSWHFKTMELKTIYSSHIFITKKKKPSQTNIVLIDFSPHVSEPGAGGTERFFPFSRFARLASAAVTPRPQRQGAEDTVPTVSDS